MSPTYPDRGNGPFHTGALILATLGNPREKMWGAILELSNKGLSMSGVDLAAFEDFVSQIKAGEAATASVMFFPMHRVERLELDLPDGSIPSLSERFAQQTNRDAREALTEEYVQPTATENRE